MTDADRTVHVDRRVHFATSSAEVVEADVLWVWNDEPIRSRLALSWQTWERVAREGLFGLGDVEVPTDLIPDLEVAIDVELRAETDADAPDPKALRKRLADPNHPLRSVDSWTATNVTQAKPVSGADPMETAFDDAVERRRGTAAEISIGHARGPAVDAAATDEGGEPIDDRPGATEEASGDERGTATESSEMAGSADRPVTFADRTTAGGEPDRSVHETVTDALTAANRPYEVRDDGRIRLWARVEGDDSESDDWDVVVDVAESTRRCVISSVYPATVPTDRRVEAASAALSFTDQLDRGSFEVADDGTVRFRTAVAVDEESIDEALVANVTTMAEYYEAIGASVR